VLFAVGPDWRPDVRIGGLAYVPDGCTLTASMTTACETRKSVDPGLCCFGLCGCYCSVCLFSVHKKRVHSAVGCKGSSFVLFVVLSHMRAWEE